MSETLLVFRGAVTAGADGELIVEAMHGPSATTRVALSGALSEATLQVLRLARRPCAANTLVNTLARDLQLEHEVASSLVHELVAAGVLSREVRAVHRLLLTGQQDLARELAGSLEHALWPAALQGIEVAVLGTLGDRAWQQQVQRARAGNTRVLTCSFDGADSWIGPWIEPGETAPRGPCPMCLHARRVARGAERQTGVALSCPPNLGLLGALLLQTAKQHARGELPHSAVLHLQDTQSSWHTLLPQPHCAICDPGRDQSPYSLAEQASHYRAALTAELSLQTSAEEPSEAQRRAFLDPWLGPLSLEVHDVRGTFRELPLVLGSIRATQGWAPDLEPRLFASVMFGTGATESRRKLVAFAEGIERYAGFTDRPDITGIPFSELAEHALAPEQTVRFSEQQYESGVSVRHDNQPLDWSWVYEWTSGQTKLMLHDAVAYGRDPLSGGAQLFEDPFSSGMSAHRSVELALERSLLELIERDAFMLAWYLRLPLRELSVRELSDGELHDLLGYLEGVGMKLKFHDLRVDFSLPTVLAVAEAQADFGPWKKGGTILSACAGKSWSEAVRHALRELLGHYTAFALVSPEGDKSIDPETGAPRPWWPAFSALLTPRSDQPLGFLGQGPKLTVSDERASSDGSLREEFLRRGLPVYIRKLGRRDIALSGLVAVRAIVPGLIRMTPSYETVNFGEPRIEQVRRRWNADQTLHPLPHPLA
ncbi:MAG: hypothetical protein JWN48_2666 [Myxococcaceae bacterium]|nr:hypothetical protein [Myxococcaceae bacterium]